MTWGLLIYTGHLVSLWSCNQRGYNGGGDDNLFGVSGVEISGFYHSVS
jgi:hypothetical protein